MDRSFNLLNAGRLYPLDLSTGKATIVILPVSINTCDNPKEDIL
jgi:hypothetical protein